VGEVKEMPSGLGGGQGRARYARGESSSTVPRSNIVGCTLRDCS